jgi:hypothetical protein
MSQRELKGLETSLIVSPPRRRKPDRKKSVDLRLYRDIHSMLITDISRSAKLDHVPSIGGNSVDEQQQEIGVASAAQASKPPNDGRTQPPAHLLTKEQLGKKIGRNRATEKKASGREDISEGPHSSSNVSMDADEGNGRQLGTRSGKNPTSEATLFEPEVSTRRPADTQLIQCPALSLASNIGESKKPPMPKVVNGYLDDQTLQDVLSVYDMRICNFTEPTVLRLAAILGLDGNKSSTRLRVFEAVYKSYVHKLRKHG